MKIHFYSLVPSPHFFDVYVSGKTATGFSRSKILPQLNLPQDVQIAFCVIHAKH
jgi:hypothetical protein